jgi:hypothetical protein
MNNIELLDIIGKKVESTSNLKYAEDGLDINFTDGTTLNISAEHMYDNDLTIVFQWLKEGKYV